MFAAVPMGAAVHVRCHQSQVPAVGVARLSELIAEIGERILVSFDERFDAPTKVDAVLTRDVNVNVAEIPPPSEPGEGDVVHIESLVRRAHERRAAQHESMMTNE